MVRVYANDQGDQSSIPGRVTPKTQKWYCRGVVGIFYSPIQLDKLQDECLIYISIYIYIYIYN